MTPEDVAATAAMVIARARESFGRDEDGGPPDAFDFYVAAHGIERYGKLYNETYVLANEPYGPAMAGCSDDDLQQRKARADALWGQLEGEMEQYANNCRQARYAGWSREEGGPIRRLR
ncbi:hypothetical protein ACFPM3_20110 [Streptomyces coeruleoprunus]|uniref:Uncharacterized protein n=1 Tax=Streptomyces coeruleoprunus TaxID=285563 RepID=A0ABV9XG99_9ACTN